MDMSYTLKCFSNAANLCESCLYTTKKRFKINYLNYIHIDMGKLHDVDFIINRGFLKLCSRPEFVYTTNFRCLPVVFTVPTQNDDLLNHDCPVKNMLLVVKLVVEAILMKIMFKFH